MGGQVFCYTFFVFIFCLFEMGPAKLGSSRRVSSSSPGTVIETTRFCVTLFSWWDRPFRAFTADFFTYRVLLPLFLVKLNDEKHILHLHTVIFPGSNLFVFLLVSFVAAGLQISLQTFHLRLVLSGVATTYRYLPTSMIFHLHTEYQQYILQHLCIDD